MSDNEDYWDTLMKKFNSMSDEEFEKRRKAFKPIEKPCTGWLRIFKENSTNAHHGASIYSADK